MYSPSFGFTLRGAGALSSRLAAAFALMPNMSTAVSKATPVSLPSPRRRVRLSGMPMYPTPTVRASSDTLRLLSIPTTVLASVGISFCSIGKKSVSAPSSAPVALAAASSSAGSSSAVPRTFMLPMLANISPSISLILSFCPNAATSASSVMPSVRSIYASTPSSVPFTRTVPLTPYVLLCAVANASGIKSSMPDKSV